MNKKFFTLLVASGLMATAVNAQQICYNDKGQVNYKEGVALTPAASDPVDPRFYFTPFGSSSTSSNTINELKNIDKGAESIYYQLQDASGNVLAMQWDDVAQKYQLVSITPSSTYNYFVDESLWEVHASYVGDSKSLRYVFVNKAAQLPLQIEPKVNDGTASATYINGSVTMWTWSEVAKNDAGLSGHLSASINENECVYLDTRITSTSFSGVITVKKAKNGQVPAGALTFTAVKAKPVALTADQVNAMMTGTKSQAPVQFNMDPEVAPSGEVVNALTSGKYKAYQTDMKDDDMSGRDANNKNYISYNNSSLNNFFGDAGNDLNTTAGYMVLAHNNSFNNLLRVDTAYHNEAEQAKYELKLTTDPVAIPREANYIAANSTATTVAKDLGKALYEQAKFRIQYLPSENSVLIQAKKYVYVSKNLDKGSWWKALVVDGYNKFAVGTSYEVAFTKITIGANGESGIASQFSGTKDNLAVSTATGVNPAAWTNNMIKLTTLTTDPAHRELTVGYDARDTEYAGIRTLITIGEKAVIPEYADIASGLYYIQNGNTVSNKLYTAGQWRYADLAATNFTETHYDSDKEAWKVWDTNAWAALPKNADKNLKDAETPNIVYSNDMLKDVPSAQWMFKGEAGFYTVTNRESGVELKSHVYMWKVANTKDTYACIGSFVDGVQYNDTITLVKAAKAPKTTGYLYLTPEEAKADTCVFNFGFNALGGDKMVLVAGSNNVLNAAIAEEGLEFKLERVRLHEKDEYTGADKYTSDMLYGGLAGDSLTRALYRIYTEDVSSNASESTSKRIRTYLTLEGGQYKLAKVAVTVDGDLYADFDGDAEINKGKSDARKTFYVKTITTNPNEFVLVDPETTNTADGNYKGVRAFVNQINAELQPAGLMSTAASLVYDNSVLTFDKVTKFNYRDIRKAGADRDSVIFYKASNDKIMLFEGSAEGANIGLLDRVNDAQIQKNYAMFIDTANVHNKIMPRFLIGLRSKDKHETGSNIPGHNRFINTTADYLMVLTDSAKVNSAYKDYQGKIRLGFVNATHEGQTLSLNNSDKTFDLSKDGLNEATFAFRYVDTERENFYIETADVDGKTLWVKTINEVPVVVDNIQDAEVFNVKSTTDAPTANDNVTVSNITVETTTGAVIVKNAAGLKVTVSNLLGQTIASEVLSSDNATIAAPAGVVVVAVEGAEAVKAIVK